MNTFIKLSVVLLFFLSAFSSCEDTYDDSAIRTEIENIQGEIDVIKTDLATLKGQLNSVQTIVEALNKGKVITQVEKLPDNRGYQIAFNDATAIQVLKHTEEQQTIESSVIGIQEVDGTYYWTVITHGVPALLSDDNGDKVPVDGTATNLSLDEYGYWTLNSKRITDANEDFVRFKKGDSSADNSEIVVDKKTETYIRFAEKFQSLTKGRLNKLSFSVSSDIETIDVVKQPEGWAVNIHRPDKYIGVTPPSDVKFGFGEIRIQGIDRNGMIYVALIKVGINGQGFNDPNGVFVLNEGNMTTENGSLIYIDGDGNIYDNIYQSMNGTSLGNVTQDLYINNKKMYIISQNGTTNPIGTYFENDGMLIVANSETLKKEASYTEELSILSWPTHIAVLDEENVFIRDNAGIYRFNTTNNELILVEGTSGAIKNRMAVADGKVFAAQGKKLLVLEKGMQSVSHNIDMGDKISGVIKSDDNNIFVATTGNPNKITKINSQDYTIIKANELTEGSLSAGMGATPGITAFGDILYYSGATTKIYRHKFDTGECKLMIDAKTLIDNAGMVYNNIAVHPKTGKVYLNTIKGYGFDFLINNITVFKATNDALELDKNYENYTHFPAGIFFPATFQ